MGIRIEKVETRDQMRTFALAPFKFNKGDPNFIGPLLPMEMETLDQAKNPFFEHGEAGLFLAYRDNELVGRISGHTNRLHNKRYRDKVGFFGFFDCENDVSTARALVDAATEYVSGKGMDTLRGPFSFSINDISGMLVEGFDTPPYMMMGHNPRYYPLLMDAVGMSKAKDLYAWHYQMGDAPDATKELGMEVLKRPEVRVRSVDRNRLQEDVDIVVDVFNAAWSKNWGFVPFTRREVEHFAQTLSMILDDHIALIAEVDDKPAAIAVALPNINECLAHIKGKPGMLDYAKVAWCLKVRRPKTARLVLLGIKPEFRGRRLGALSVGLYVEIHRRARERGYVAGEMGWTLEDNEKINLAITLMGGVHYKTYRIYETAI